MDWQSSYADRVLGLTQSEIRRGIAAAANPDFISLAGGVPAAELFPANEFREAYDRVLRDAPGVFLQYGPTEGYAPLRSLIAERERVDVPEILVTSGAQQGLDLLGRLLINPGDRVLVEDPSYLGALETFRPYHPDLVAVPVDDEGIVVDVVEDELRRGGAKFLYTMPNFANPSGLTMSAARRVALLELSQRWSLPVVEDDAYGRLRYDGDPLPSLSTADNVIRLGSFSKILSPGLRVGWIQAHPDVIRKLVHLKERADLCGAPGAQMVVAAMGDLLDTHVKTLVDAYRRRRDVMVEALEEFCPSLTWRRPDGGFFVWCSAPVDAYTLLEEVDGVAFVPGAKFHANRPRPNTIRLSFAGVSPERIHEGVRRIGRALP